jgi:Tfp pilus assembly protein PilX
MPNNFLKQSNSQQGATTLIITFFVLSTILMIALTAAGIAVFEIRRAREISDSIPAFYASDAAAEKCLYQARRLRNNAGCNQTSGSTSVALSNGARGVARRQNNKINAYGIFNQTKRSVEVEWQ